MAKPSLELAVEVTGADGTQHRWGPGARAGDVPQGLSFRTKQGEGFADANVTLARRIDRDYVDLHLLGWGEVSRARKIALLAAEASPDGPAVNPDSSGLAALETTVQGPLQASVFPKCEALYDAGPGMLIAKVYYDWQRAATTTNPSWLWDIQAADDDSFATAATTGELQAEPASTGAAYYTPAATHRYLEVRLLWNSTTGDSGANKYSVFWRNLAIYGDHGLPLIGDTDPKGVAASDVIRHLIGKYCPLLDSGGVQATTYPIPHLAFHDRTDPYDAILEVNKYHLWQFGVYDNRTLEFGPVDMSDYDWEVRLSDPGTKVELQGDSASDLANGIVVTYQNVSTGKQDVLTPDDHPELRDTGPENPATLAGINKWMEITLSSPSTMDAALQVGRAALAENNQPKAPGTITVQGHIRDRVGHWQPCWKVRASDRLILSDHPNDRARLVVETDYQNDSKTISIAVDSSFKRLDAVLDRLGTALRAANLAA
jgi:hypothetical protein